MADVDQTARSTPLYALLPPAVKQILLLVGLAAAVAAGVALVLWSQGGNYTPLYSGLSERDIGEITAQLDGAGVKYKLDPTSGGLLVPSDKKYEVRMQLASSGLPHGTGFGVEDMPNKSTFGQTPFMENALYVRAVETELARTIGAMQPVENARVHLALPPQSVFLRQKREPSASVMLKLYSGRRLDEGQVQAVVHLVAASVPELLPSHVTVVDQAGTLLTGASSDDAASLSSSQFEYRKQIEQEYSRRIEGLLGSIVGAERVRSSVSAELDFTVTEQTRESFDPGGSSRAQRADERGLAPRRRRARRARRAEQPAASSRAANARSERRGQCRRGCSSGRATKRVALRDSQLRARQDREPHPPGRRRDQAPVDRRAGRQQAGGQRSRRRYAARRAGARIAHGAREEGRRIRRDARRHDFGLELRVPAGRRGPESAGAELLGAPAVLDDRAPRRSARCS